MANEKQLDNELIEELQERLDALNSESVMDVGVIDGFLTAHALNLCSNGKSSRICFIRAC